MRIVFLNPAGAIGGAERALIDIIASLKKARPDWQLSLIAAADGDLVRQARELGAQASVVVFPGSLAVLGDAGTIDELGGRKRSIALAGRLAMAMPAIAIYRQRLARAIREAAPDVVHTNGFKMHVLGASAAPRSIPMLWHIHDFVRARPMMAPLLRAYVGRCSAIVANSHSVAADIKAALRHTPPIFTVYNAVNLFCFTPKSNQADLDRLAGLPPLSEGGVRVGIVATMARWKGHETFLRAISLLPTTMPVRAYVIGGPLYETEGSQYKIAELREMATQMGLEGRVGFTGFVSEVAPVMRALDVVVHASTQPEPFGLVIAEAMACGRAVIVSAAGGAAEIIEDGIDAMAHPPGDAEELARLIAKLATDPAMRQRLGDAAAKASARRFTHERLANDLVPIYQSISPAAA
ncbi:MAG: glycosyltransferase family 4 protein [Deltaproteobacteria bacterium]|nr:glycosyltransferase family 4 protein [Deltaproteobacteria bacterium]